MRPFKFGVGGRFGKGTGRKINLKLADINVSTLSTDKPLAKKKLGAQASGSKSMWAKRPS